jgi:hypothetical protein
MEAERVRKRAIRENRCRPQSTVNPRNCTPPPSAECAPKWRPQALESAPEPHFKPKITAKAGKGALYTVEKPVETIEKPQKEVESKSNRRSFALKPKIPVFRGDALFPRFPNQITHHGRKKTHKNESRGRAARFWP